jgi:hypothetical protein
MIARRPALVLAVVLGAIDAILINWSQPIFGGWWKHVMWESGVIEDLTAVFFIVGAVIFALCVFRRDAPVVHRVWFGFYAFAMLVLAGEETNYGKNSLFLDLADPNFAVNYNKQGGNIHNSIFKDAIVPITIFVVICIVLRLTYRWLVPLLRLPMSKDFLEAVMITAGFAVFTINAFRDDRFLSVDEAYEWSSSLLLLCLALYYRFGWVFRPRAGDVGFPPLAGVS